MCITAVFSFHKAFTIAIQIYPFLLQTQSWKSCVEHGSSSELLKMPTAHGELEPGGWKVKSGIINKQRKARVLIVALQSFWLEKSYKIIKFSLGFLQLAACEEVLVPCHHPAHFRAPNVHSGQEMWLLSLTNTVGFIHVDVISPLSCCSKCPLQGSLMWIQHKCHCAVVGGV